jgi:Flp pilus assembly pilin Flp
MRLGREDGQTLAEYAVVLGVITILIITAISTLSGAIAAQLDSISSLLP